MTLRRRDFITLVVGAAAWPLAARAQLQKMRRIGVPMTRNAEDSEEQARLTAILQGLQERGWTDGRNVRIDIRWSAGDPDRRRRYAAELVALSPDVIIADTSTPLAALLQATQTVPIVFAGVIDPISAGFVASLARPGGNATGFTSFDYGTGARTLLADGGARRVPELASDDAARGSHDPVQNNCGHRLPAGARQPVRNVRTASGAKSILGSCLMRWK